MNHRQILIAGFLLLLAAGSASAGTRIIWDPGNSSTVLDVIDGESRAVTRLAIHEGRLTAFSPADTRLFAVFLRGEDDVARLKKSLRRHSSRSVPEILRDALSGPASFDELKLESNGRLTLFADEAVLPEKHWVAVVNSSGEILGSRPLWQADRELAVLE